MLVSALVDAQRRFPGKLAVDDGLRPLTYKRLTALAVAMRTVVAHATEADKVGIMLPASSAFPGTLFGVWWSGKIAVPLNFLLSPGELAAIVEDAGLDLIVTVRHFAKLVEGLPARVLFLDELPLRRKVLFALLRPNPPTPTVEPDATAVLLYTSGTTAAPKGVELTYANLHGNCVDAIRTLNLDSSHTFLNVLPPFHVFGLTGLVLLPIFLGATVHAVPRFSPVAMTKTVESRRVTMIMAIPSMYAAVLKTKSAGRDSFRTVSLAVSGGEPLPDAVREGFQERFGVILHEGYGLTETSPVVSANTLEASRVGSVGRAIHRVQIKVVTPDGEEAPTGTDGEILVKGPGVMKGYYNQPEATHAVLQPDGWFHTGDLGTLDSGGFLTITGRLKEMLIIGGENVYPREIEAALERHESVLQAAVIGMPDGLRGEVPVAFVIPQPEVVVTEQALREFAKQSVAGFKVPRRIVIRDDLPKGPTGKLLKRCLRDLL